MVVFLVKLQDKIKILKAFLFVSTVFPFKNISAVKVVHFLVMRLSNSSMTWIYHISHQQKSIKTIHSLTTKDAKETKKHGRKNISWKNIYVLYFPDATGIFPCFLLISLQASSTLLTRIKNIIFKE